MKCEKWKYVIYRIWCPSSITRQNIELFFIKNTGYLFDPLNPDQEVHADGDPELLDDSEFYQQLLKEFFETFDPNSSGNIIWHLVYTHDLCFVTWMWEYHSFQKESIWISLDYISLARYPGYRAFIWLTGWTMRGAFFTFIVYIYLKNSEGCSSTILFYGLSQFWVVEMFLTLYNGLWLLNVFSLLHLQRQPFMLCRG